jgi:hypothetical protein
MKHLFVALALLFGTFNSWSTFAGPGANMNVCVYKTIRLVEPLKLKVERLPSMEMSVAGLREASIDVKNKGFTCVSMGYVEAIRGFNPYASRWPVGYTLTKAKNGEHEASGSTNTDWAGHFPVNNQITLLDSSPETSICASANDCKNTSIEWEAGTQGPLYIIFRPDQQK